MPDIFTTPPSFSTKSIFATFVTIKKTLAKEVIGFLLLNRKILELFGQKVAFKHRL